MSTQTPELLKYQGEKRSFHEEPLASYLEFHEIDDRFLSYSSENERGYIGLWEILDNKLHLVDLKGFNHKMKLIGMLDIFLDADAIFAGWYSGEINILLNTGIANNKKQWIKRRLVFIDGVLVDEIDLPR